MQQGVFINKEGEEEYFDVPDFSPERDEILHDLLRQMRYWENKGKPEYAKIFEEAIKRVN